MTLRGLAVAALLACAAARPACFAAQSPPPSLCSEAREHLKAMVALDTSNPPGNEGRVVDYIKGRLDREGIPASVVVFSTGRSSLIATLRGTGAKRPIIIVCHTDVVPAEAAQWATDPFSPVEKDGYLYGRGSADNKSMCAAALSVVAHLKRGARKLARDVIFLAHGDEESGGSERHLDWLLERNGPALDAELGIIEGGNTVWKDGRVAELRVQTAEKDYMDITLTARGSSGHSSIPRPDNAVVALARAVARLSEHRPRASLSPVVRTFLTRQAESARADLRPAVERVLKSSPEELDAAADGLEAVSLDFAAMLRDTITPTMLRGGFKSNVVPAQAEAVLNARLLPGTDPKMFLSLLSTVVADPTVDIHGELPSHPAVAPMPTDTDLYRAVEKVAAAQAPGAVVMPFMAVWTTEALALRSRGAVVYGLDPPLSDEDGSRVHGSNERISLEAFDWYVRFLSSVVGKVAGGKQ